MNRRSFFRLIGAAAAVAVIDPERLLWTPGQTTHILPPLAGWRRNPLLGLFNPPPGLYESFRNADLAFHKDAFALVMEPLLDVSAIAKAMADRIDRDVLAICLHDLELAAIRLQRQADGVPRVDILYGIGTRVRG